MLNPQGGDWAAIEDTHAEGVKRRFLVSNGGSHDT